METRVLNDRDGMYRQAAEYVAAGLAEAVEQRGRATLIAGTAPVLRSLYSYLAQLPGIAWQRIRVIQAEEYAFVRGQEECLGQALLKSALLDRLSVRPWHVHRIYPNLDLESECVRLSGATADAMPADVAVLAAGSDGGLGLCPVESVFAAEAPFIRVRLEQGPSARLLEWEAFVRKSDLPAQAISIALRCMRGSRRVACVASGLDPAVLENHRDAVVFRDRPAPRSSFRLDAADAASSASLGAGA